jgi:hypothetical protein
MTAAKAAKRRAQRRSESAIKKPICFPILLPDFWRQRAQPDRLAPDA